MKIDKIVFFNICDLIQVKVYGNGYIQSVIQQNFHNFRCKTLNKNIKTLKVYVVESGETYDNNSFQLFIKNKLSRKEINTQLFSAIRKLILIDGFVLVHGALIKNDKEITLYSGKAGSGKTNYTLRHLIDNSGDPLCDDVAIVGDNMIIPLPRYLSLGPKEYKYARILGFVRHQNVIEKLFVKFSVFVKDTFISRIFPFRYTHFLWDNNQQMFRDYILKLRGVNSIEGLLEISDIEWPLILTSEESAIQVKCLERNILI